MIEGKGPRPRYKWRLTWPDKADDFKGFDGIWTVGTIHVHHLGNWLWFCGLSEYTTGPALWAAAGSAPTARLAAKEVEDCYDRMLAGDWPGMPGRTRSIAMTLAVREGRAGTSESSTANA